MGITKNLYQKTEHRILIAISKGRHEENEIIRFARKGRMDLDYIKRVLINLEKSSVLISTLICTFEYPKSTKLYEISKGKGTDFFFKTFGECPNTSRLNKLIKDHDNLNHAWSIQEVSNLVKNGNKSKFSTLRKDNTFGVSAYTKHKYIPDITYYDRVNDEFIAIEIEMNSLSIIQFIEKIIKGCLVSKISEIRVIVSTPYIKKKYKRWFDNLIHDDIYDEYIDIILKKLKIIDLPEIESRKKYIITIKSEDYYNSIKLTFL